MAVQLLYNKIALQQFDKALKIRYAALPTIRSKENALRMEVKKQRNALNKMKSDYEKEVSNSKTFGKLWKEFPHGIISINAIHKKKASFAGVKFEVLDYIDFHLEGFYLPVHPMWWLKGIDTLKELVAHKVSLQLKEAEVAVLEKERKRTTQKLNLYEKVQIPEYEESIRKIKRFLEDQENLEKATQKIVKNKQQRQEA